MFGQGILPGQRRERRSASHHIRPGGPFSVFFALQVVSADSPPAVFQSVKKVVVAPVKPKRAIPEDT
jgi:hypothetical protein